jgi:uncharacterized damage-inducible protein DinB
MSEARRIKDQLKRAFEGEAWHGPSVCEVLDSVNAEQAAAHPLSGAHSIWELALHICAWERIARRRIEEWVPIEVTSEEDWPPVDDTSEHAWKNVLNRLKLNHATLEELVGRLDDDRLKEQVPGTPYNVYFLLHGVIQHDLYHAGQIAMLKKA